MKRIIKKIIGSIKNFLNRMVENEAGRIIRLYSQISETTPNKGKGGEGLK